MSARVSRTARKVGFWLATAVVVFSSHWVAESLWHWAQHGVGHDPSVGLAAAALAVFAAASATAYALRKVVTRPETLVPHDAAPPPLPVLVWFLSDPGKGTPDGIPAWFQPGTDLDADLDTLGRQRGPDRRWNWEMLLWAARHHAGRLRAVVLITSPESAPLAHGVGRLLGRYEVFKGVRVLASARRADGAAELIPVPAGGLRADQGWNFENFSDLTTAAVGAVDRLNTAGVPGDPGLPRVRDAAIMVDFTGGQKVTSVVAATVTFNRRIRAEYVSTHDHTVRGYDLVLEAPDPAGGHGH